MARLSMEERGPFPEKKKKGKKTKGKNLVPFDWSGEQEPVGSSSAQHQGSSHSTSPNVAGDTEEVSPTASDNFTGVQEQVQDVEPGDGASPKPTGEAEAMVRQPSDSSKGVQEQVHKVEYGDGTSPELSGKAEATIPIDPELQKLAKTQIASGINLEIQKQATVPIASNIDPEILKLAKGPIASDIGLEIQKQAEAHIASDIDSDTQKQAQAAEAIPEPTGEAEPTIPTEPEISVTSKSSDYQSAETSFDGITDPARSISSPNVQQNDTLPCDSHSPTTSGQTGEHDVLQQDQEEQNADNTSLENMRPNAQNLRYGGYPAQPAAQHRNTPLGSGRLQNTSKLGGLEILSLVLYNRKADVSALVR